MITTSDKSKVVLVYPGTGFDVAGVSVFLPLSVLLPAAALEHAGYEVSLIDMRTERGWRERIALEVREGALYVGISAMTGTQIAEGLAAAEAVRAENADVPIVWGGIHPSILPDQTLADDRVDAVVAGRGEAVAVEIAEKLAGGERSLALGVHKGREPSAARAERMQPQIPYERHDWRRYVTPVVNHHEGLAHVSSRGCPHRCSYCYNRSVNRSRWRAEPAEAVLEDLERLHALGVTSVLMFDDNFFVDRGRIERIARGLIDRRMRMHIKADCRADYVTRYDAAFLRFIRRAGIECVYIGGESGSDRVLSMIRKDVTVGQLLDANRRLAKAGIRPHYSFMAGLPGETIDDMRATVRLMRRLLHENRSACLSPVKGYVPYPGTELFDKAVRLGFDAPGTLDAWSRFDWNGAPRPWLSPAEELFVEKASYVTGGLGTELFESSGLASSPLVSRLYRLYSGLCRRRCAKSDLGSVPELPVLRAVKRLMAAI